MWGRLDPVIARLSAWADEAPEVMRRLLTDEELRRSLLDAILDIVGCEVGNERERSSKRSG